MLTKLPARPGIGRTASFHPRDAVSGPLTVRARAEPAAHQPGS